MKKIIFTSLNKIGSILPAVLLIIMSEPVCAAETAFEKIVPPQTSNVYVPASSIQVIGESKTSNVSNFKLSEFPAIWLVSESAESIAMVPAVEPEPKPTEEAAQMDFKDTTPDLHTLQQLQPKPEAKTNRKKKRRVVQKKTNNVECVADSSPASNSTKKDASMNAQQKNK
jgi:hypothetical protein